MQPNLTQSYTLALIARAEKRGWKVETFETFSAAGDPRFCPRQRPRFVLYMTRVEHPESLFSVRYIFHAFIGSGRISGKLGQLGFGIDRKSDFGNWGQAASVVDTFGDPKIEAPQV